jgi:AraC-like DNA-binding protein
MAINVIEIQEEKEASYRSLVRPQLMEELKEKILEKLLVRKLYRNSGYTAKQLAVDLGTNVRYVSAVIRVQFHTNYSTLVNKYRVEEAMSLLTDQRYDEHSVEEIGDMVGFAQRQSFHSYFQKYVGMTPRAYRMQYRQQLSSKQKKDDEQSE